MEEGRADLIQHLQSSFGASSSSPKKQQVGKLELSQPGNSHFHNLSPESKRPGIPPSHPHYHPTSPSLFSSRQSTGIHYSTAGPNPAHSRSLSQPAFFSLDSLPPLSPASFRDSSPSVSSDHVSADVSIEERDDVSQGRNSSSVPFACGNPSRVPDSLPPRKSHRRSHSEIPFAFVGGSLTAPSFTPQSFLDRSSSMDGTLGPKIKQEFEWERSNYQKPDGIGEKKSEGEVADDLFSAYMNLDNVEALNSSGISDKQGSENYDDLDTGASGTKGKIKEDLFDSSDNDAESSVNEMGDSVQGMNPSALLVKDKTKREGNSHIGEANLFTVTSHHSRSMSMDSCFMGRMPNFAEESPKLPPSPGNGGLRRSCSNSMDGAAAAFSLEFGNGEFSGAELKKIMTNEKLAEIAMADPKRAKRILANRQSAARSKERKMRYISELEHKVQTLQTEATTLSAQLTLLQRDSAGLMSQNNELKFRLQAMEQQAQLRDALNEALTEEVQRLRLATTQLGDSHGVQMQMNPQLFNLQQQNQLPAYQTQQQQKNSTGQKLNVTANEGNQ